MNFYKITDEALQQQMTTYIQEVELVEKAADELASSVGAAGYEPSPYGEFGGIIALDFAKKAPRYFRYAGKDGDICVYEPAVTVTESVETEGFVRGIEFKQNLHTHYSVREVTLDQARSMMDYKRAIELANIHWEGANIMTMAEKYRVAPSWIQLYDEGKLNFGQLCIKAKDYALTVGHFDIFNKELREAMQLELKLQEAFSKIKLYQVKRVTGNKFAVEFYKKMAALPLIPAGRLAAILGVDFPTEEVTCPAFFRTAEGWYVATKGTINGDRVAEISEMEYETAKMHRGVN